MLDMRLFYSCVSWWWALGSKREGGGDVTSYSKRSSTLNSLPVSSLRTLITDINISIFKESGKRFDHAYTVVCDGLWLLSSKYFCSSLCKRYGVTPSLLSNCGNFHTALSFILYRLAVGVNICLLYTINCNYQPLDNIHNQLLISKPHLSNDSPQITAAQRKDIPLWTM